MEPLSYQHSTFLLDSIFLPNTPIKMSSLLEGEDVNTSCFSNYPSEQPLQETPIDVIIQESSCVDSSTKVIELDSSGDQVSHKENSIDKKRKNKDGSCLTSAKSQEGKSKKQKKCNVRKGTVEKKSKADHEKKKQDKGTQETPTCYIHVRARRGEATDSHSLAERVRREKISMRMKFLQSLVPGCDKVSGKAHMLDEIINYVQSLQYQVEFLSMKLASVNPMSFNFAEDLDALDAFMVKSEKLNSLASPLSSMLQSNPTQPIDFADTTTTLSTRNNYNNSVSFLYQQGQSPNNFSQDNENLLWDVEDQRQKFINQCGFNMCSFH